jgi:hypothetical protein
VFDKADHALLEPPLFRAGVPDDPDALDNQEAEQESKNSYEQDGDLIHGVTPFFCEYGLRYKGRFWYAKA